jgi:septation ring formation regulator EzrA
MDQDLLNYLDQRFSSIDQRFSSIDQQFSSIDRRFSSIDQRFSSIDQQFSSIDQRFQETGQQIQALREENARQFERVDQRFEKVETEIRSAYVAIEGLQSEVRLVAADGILNVTEQLNRHREEVSIRFGEIESLNRRVFDELRSFRDDHDDHEVRISRLEATG